MNKIFTGYGVVVMLIFAIAAHEGYAWSSLFANAHHAGASENHYHK